MMDLVLSMRDMSNEISLSLISWDTDISSSGLFNDVEHGDHGPIDYRSGCVVVSAVLSSSEIAVKDEVGAETPSPP